jgi:hypothetical protein
MHRGYAVYGQRSNDLTTAEHFEVVADRSTLAFRSKLRAGERKTSGTVVEPREDLRLRHCLHA